jgi:hypothetical protein
VTEAAAARSVLREDLARRASRAAPPSADEEFLTALAALREVRKQVGGEEAAPGPHAPPSSVEREQVRELLAQEAAAQGHRPRRVPSVLVDEFASIHPAPPASLYVRRHMLRPTHEQAGWLGEGEAAALSSGSMLATAEEATTAVHDAANISTARQVLRDTLARWSSNSRRSSVTSVAPFHAVGHDSASHRHASAPVSPRAWTGAAGGSILNERPSQLFRGARVTSPHVVHVRNAEGTEGLAENVQAADGTRVWLPLWGTSRPASASHGLRTPAATSRGVGPHSFSSSNPGSGSRMVEIDRDLASFRRRRAELQRLRQQRQLQDDLHNSSQA